MFQPAAEYPSELQKKDALAAALEAGYSKHTFSQILRYGIDLNIRILDYDQTSDDIDIMLNTADMVHITPLEWTVEHERLDLVNLFLDNGADANFTISPGDGPALFKAVKRKSRKALALAVEQKDVTIANTLLAHGVCCDFEESDRPLPPGSISWCSFSNINSRELEAKDLIPPLVRVARLGNVALVSLLLEHGADANVAYHDLGGRRDKYEIRDSIIPANFSCGRVVQIAMEMGYSEVVRLLIDAGADINLPHSVWPSWQLWLREYWPLPGHVCQPISRAVYVKVGAGLEAAVAAKREGKV
ncbi:hypothetical protein BDV26DRAFT_288040 [Aspergillus bertholletiae]|uniref:Ankyrin repeat-containing domain protein n=1 Tax=Aspergillus bertholletiae TaxID=1226010 RepID=A0A5N7BMG4_9EURO|nr:hypothetical protein BDV26DRAFT_288040 [Aspergillus bertholletiae]